MLEIENICTIIFADGIPQKINKINRAYFESQVNTTIYMHFILSCHVG